MSFASESSQITPMILYAHACSDPFTTVVYPNTPSEAANLYPAVQQQSETGAMAPAIPWFCSPDESII